MEAVRITVDWLSQEDCTLLTAEKRSFKIFILENRQVKKKENKSYTITVQNWKINPLNLVLQYSVVKFFL